MVQLSFKERFRRVAAKETPVVIIREATEFALTKIKDEEDVRKLVRMFRDVLAKRNYSPAGFEKTPQYKANLKRIANKRKKNKTTQQQQPGVAPQTVTVVLNSGAARQEKGTSAPDNTGSSNGIVPNNTTDTIAVDTVPNAVDSVTNTVQVTQPSNALKSSAIAESATSSAANVKDTEGNFAVVSDSDKGNDQENHANGTASQENVTRVGSHENASMSGSLDTQTAESLINNDDVHVDENQGAISTGNDKVKDVAVNGQKRRCESGSEDAFDFDSDPDWGTLSQSDSTSSHTMIRNQGKKLDNTDLELQTTAKDLVVDFWEGKLPPVETVTIFMDRYAALGITFDELISSGIVDCMLRTLKRKHYDDLGSEAGNMLNAKGALDASGSEKMFWCYVGMWQSFVDERQSESINSEDITKSMNDHISGKNFMNLRNRRSFHLAVATGRRFASFINHTRKYKSVRLLAKATAFVNHIPSTYNADHKSKAWWAAFVEIFCEQGGFDGITYAEIRWEELVRPWKDGSPMTQTLSASSKPLARTPTSVRQCAKSQDTAVKPRRFARLQPETQQIALTGNTDAASRYQVMGGGSLPVRRQLYSRPTSIVTASTQQYSMPYSQLGSQMFAPISYNNVTVGMAFPNNYTGGYSVNAAPDRQISKNMSNEGQHRFNGLVQQQRKRRATDDRDSPHNAFARLNSRVKNEGIGTMIHQGGLETNDVDQNGIVN